MAITLTFLEGYAPLTKTIRKNKDGSITKDTYPEVKNFTTHHEKISTLVDMFKALVKHATSSTKPCLIKGKFAYTLNKQPRKGCTNTNDKTNWVCLDLDDAPFASAAEFMKALGAQDLAYIWQASSSFGLEKKKTLSGHIFFLLDEPVAAPILRTWLMGLNFDVPALEKFLRLSNGKQCLSYPLDITTCQNDKLLYIAEPIFIGLTSPIKAAERIQFVTGKTPLYPVKSMKLHAMDILNKKARIKLNGLRDLEGMPPLSNKIKQEGEIVYQPGVGAITQYEVIDCDEFYRFNLNGGNSQAYWHSKDDLKYLHNFKGEPSVLLKEILPDHYAELVERKKTDSQTPSANGDLLLAFREKRTADYWKGIYNPSEPSLEIYKVKNETQLMHFLMGHGRSAPPYVPEWEIIFDPHKNFVVDENRHIVNAFVPTKLMRVENTQKGSPRNPFPIFQSVLNHAVGPQDSPVQEHFLNWLACIIQHRVKTKTAWILHGTEGTGKGIIVNSVMKPILEQYCNIVPGAQLTHDFNKWQEHKLLILIDEIEVDLFEKPHMEGSLRNLITEPWVQTHRKGIDSYESPSFVNIIFSANKNEPVRIPLNDRRFNVGQRQPNKYETTREIIEKELPKELPAIANYLLTRKADVDKAGQILQTSDREQIQKLGISSIDLVANAIKEGDLSTLFEAMPDTAFLNQVGIVNLQAEAYVSVMQQCLHDAVNGEETRLTRDQLAIIFEYGCGTKTQSPNKFTSMLRHHSLHMDVVWVDNKSTRGKKVKWYDTVAQLKDLRGHLPEKRLLKRVK